MKPDTEIIAEFRKKYDGYNNSGTPLTKSEYLASFILSLRHADKKYLREKLEEMPAAFPERQSDEYDAGYTACRAAVQKLLE